MNLETLKHIEHLCKRNGQAFYYQATEPSIIIGVVSGFVGGGTIEWFKPVAEEKEPLIKFSPELDLRNSLLKNTEYRRLSDLQNEILNTEMARKNDWEDYVNTRTV